jgi:putative oxidoreductase
MFYSVYWLRLKSMFRSLIATPADAMLLVLRLFLGVVFFPHGAQKVLGWFGGAGFSGTMGSFEKMGIPAIFAFLAIMAEFAGSLGLLVGFLGRIAAFGILVNMLVAILFVHAKNGMFMNWQGNQAGEGFEYHLLVIAIAIVLIVRGSGLWSIDRAITVRDSGVRGS